LFPTGFRERLKAFTGDSSEVFAAGAFQVMGSTVTDSMAADSKAADSMVAVIINPRV
jgi:hypothetical protein